MKHFPKTFFTIILFCGFFGLAKNTSAAPSVSGVSGTVSDGQSVTISGSAFGTNSAVGTSNLEFLGGKNGPIESGTTGQEFSRTHWDIDTEWGNDIQVTTSNAPWGTKVLQMTGPYTSSGSGNPEAPLYYNLPSPINASDYVFVSWWERVTWTGKGQYKIIRFSPTQTIVDSPGNQDVYFFHNNAEWVEYCRDGGPCALYPDFGPGDTTGVWQRHDIEMKTSSPNSVTLTQYQPGTALQSVNATSYTSSASSVWNWIVWQNYFGTDATGQMTQGDVWLKDIYISHGTPARVELCDSSTWSARQKCIIQPPSSWNAGSIGVTLNQGNFANSSTAYLYVVDSSGATNANGYSLTLGSGGGGGGDTTPPAAPSGLSVV